MEVAEDFDTDLVKNDQELVVVVHMASIKAASKHRKPGKKFKLSS